VLHHQELIDPGDHERLGVSELLLEPRIVTSPSVTVFWKIGAALYRSENRLVNTGINVGFGASVTPIHPLLFETRMAIQALGGGTTLVDISGQVGCEIRPRLFGVVGYRGLGGTGTSLHVVSLGLQIDTGFGDRRPSNRTLAHGGPGPI
jgi:hypothetical protein